MGFELGQLVALRADRARRGPVIAVLDKVGGVPRYRVFHSGNDFREYQEDQLVAETVLNDEQSVAALMSSGEWLDTDTFRARLTAARLSNPQLDSVYALHSARIQFIPFQFKPLLRFLRADAPRLLIADEVGVGKTIEAGLILNEISARQQLRNVLIVCPKALTTKWQSEMRRFDQSFRILDSKGLTYCLDETFRDGEWPEEYSRSIVHLELVRMSDYLDGRTQKPGLRTLSPPPHFDLLILDEAHHVRNTDTSSREAARILADCSDAAVFLSATPVHIGSQNLFSLLNLLRPENFLDMPTFRQMVEPNQFIIEAMRSVRGGKGDYQKVAANALLSAAETSWGRTVLSTDPRFVKWRQRIEDEATFSDVDRVRCIRDLEETHTLSHVMNRTRRRDIRAFTIREPKTITVPFTPEQQTFYDAVLSFRRAVLGLKYNPQVVALVTDTLQRQAASCLPALVTVLESFIATGRFDIGEMTDDPDIEIEVPADGYQDLPAALNEAADDLRRLAITLPPVDPKVEQLLGQIIEPTAKAEPGKVLIFSFFLHTLRYLKKRISDAGHRVDVVYGQLPEQERQSLRDRFRLPKEDPLALDVLLSSEVGCEGLDYEFCDRLVNYDIPWNPMRLEQRIGRVDRFGQKSEKVLIFNFVTPGTVEDRIFFRCYDRLDVFTQTIGDMEEILGETIRELTKTALDPTLTAEQQEEKTRQSLDNAIRNTEEQRRLEEESGNILGLDQSLLQEVDALQAEGRYVAADEIRHMLGTFLSMREIDGKVQQDGKHPALYKLRVGKDGKRFLLNELERLEGGRSHLVQELRRWLESADQSFAVTFDQEIALQYRQIPFITPIHPLVKCAVNYWKLSRDTLIVSSLVVSERDVPAGRYIFACDLWEYVAIQSDVRLVGAAWSEHTGKIETVLSGKIIPALTRVQQPKDKVVLGESQVLSGLAAVDEYLESLRSDELCSLRDTNSLVANRQLASLELSARSRIEKLRSDIEAATEERIKRMKDSEVSRLERNLELKCNEIRRKMDPDIITRRVAAGVIDVVSSERWEDELL